MKIQIASDLHIESWRGRLPDEHTFRPVKDRDLLVLAGDIHVELGALAFIQRELAHSPVVYVAGNHEHYGRKTHDDLTEAWKWIASETDDLYFLSGKAATIEGVRIYGCTWYSDLWGNEDPWASAAVGRYTSDFRAPHHDGGSWSVKRHVETHREETRDMRSYAGEVDLIVTHWPPTLHALDPFYANAIGSTRQLNPYFINDQEGLVREMGAQYWVSGHTHTPHEAQIGTTTSIGNPAGYRDERRDRQFRPDRTVEIRR